MANRQATQATQEVLGIVDQAVKKEFESNRRILTFDEYLALLGEKPKKQLRGSAEYMADMMDYFGKEPLSSGSTHGEPGANPLMRFAVFNSQPELGIRKVVGQEQVQNRIYQALKTFSRQGINNKLLLLHGPNGSAKTSLIHALMSGMERYSRENDGAIYGFNWIFPVESLTKGGIGFNTYTSSREPLLSYAKLPDQDVMARIPCELKDHPFLLVPQDQRKSLLEKMLGTEQARTLWESLPQYLTKGDLCHRCKQIFEALLNSNSGDYRKVLAHVQVERIYFSRRYRKGLVTVEPQLHVDAHFQQLTLNKSMTSLPPSLQSLNLFSLSGDLIEGNRGMVEYSDLLKRPIDSFKYLLIACETGSVNVGSTIAYTDTVMLGSTNELQLDAFKEFPDFTSFKARIELVRVPYLLSVSEEEQIYQPDLNQITIEKHVAPHTAWVLSLWAVLTRLKKPNSINYPPNISSIVSNLSPMEKARLYDRGEMPMSLSPEERKLLRSAMKRLREEYSNIPYYEGRMGASAREMKSILFGAAQNQEFCCVTPLAVFKEMEEFVKHVSEYEFLKQDVKDGFHDSAEFINVVRSEYLSRIDREVRDSIGLYDSQQWEEFLKKYVLHISLVLKKEKIKNPITGKLEEPDMALINEFEKIVEAPAESGGRASEVEAFRQNIISQVGAWSLDHPNELVVYAQVFPEFWHKLEKHYYESQKSLLTKMHNALLFYDKEDADLLNRVSEEGDRLARQTVGNMKAKLGYCEHCAKEVVNFLMRQRY